VLWELFKLKGLLTLQWSPDTFCRIGGGNVPCPLCSHFIYTFILVLAFFHYADIERWREPAEVERSARVTASVREQLKRFIGVIWQASRSPPASRPSAHLPPPPPSLGYLATCVVKSSNIKSWRCCGSCTTSISTHLISSPRILLHLLSPSQVSSVIAVKCT